MLAEAAPKGIDRGYVLAPDVNRVFRKHYKNAPAHLGRPTRHQYAFLSGVMRVTPKVESVVVEDRETFIIADENFNRKNRIFRTERELTSEEIASIIKVAQKFSGTNKQLTFREALLTFEIISATPASLDVEVGESGDETLINFIADEQAVDPAEVNDQVDLPEMVDRVLAGLSERERTILNMRVGRGYDHAMTLEEVGREFKITRERVRQVEAKARRKAKPHFIRAGALEYIRDLR